MSQPKNIAGDFWDGLAAMCFTRDPELMQRPDMLGGRFAKALPSPTCRGSQSR